MSEQNQDQAAAVLSGDTTLACEGLESGQVASALNASVELPPENSEAVAGAARGETELNAGAASLDAQSEIVTIERGPWSIDLSTVMYVTSEPGGGVVVATSKGGYVLTAEEAAPFMRFVK